MRKILGLSMALLGSAALFVGCQKQMESELGDMTDGAKKGNVTRKAAGTASCDNGGCLLEGQESAASKATGTYQNGDKVDVEITNTTVSVIFRFKSNAPMSYFRITSTGMTTKTVCLGTPVVAGTVYEITIPKTDFTSWGDCELKTFSITNYKNNCTGMGGGQAVTYTATHKLVPECPTCDEELLTYETADNLNIVFSYNDDEPLTAATVEFTFPQVLDLPLNENNMYVAPDGKMYTVNNPTNQTVFTWVGDLPCSTEEAETFSFSFQADCSAPPANDGKAIIWTDFKVNGESKKGSNVNIVYTGCPVN